MPSILHASFSLYFFLVNIKIFQEKTRLLTFDLFTSVRLCLLDYIKFLNYYLHLSFNIQLFWVGGYSLNNYRLSNLNSIDDSIFRENSLNLFPNHSFNPIL